MDLGLSGVWAEALGMATYYSMSTMFRDMFPVSRFALLVSRAWELLLRIVYGSTSQGFVDSRRLASQLSALTLCRSHDI